MEGFPSLLDVASKKISKPCGFVYLEEESDAVSISSTSRKRDAKAARKDVESARQ